MKLLASSVIAPAQDYNLTTLAAIKLEFDIRTPDNDVYLGRQIPRVSASVASYCRRIFARQGYLDTFSNRFRWRCDPSRDLRLAHWPVVQIETVDTGGTPLVEGIDFTVDAASGILINKRHNHWGSFLGDVEVSYIAGWVLPGWAVDSTGGPSLPADVEQAAIQLVLSNRQAGRLGYTDRDPFVRSETVEGVGTFAYSQTAIGSSTSGSVGGISATVMQTLAAYRVPLGIG